MNDPRLADQATGLELQIEEAMARRKLAARKGWIREVRELEVEITELYVQLAETAEAATDDHFPRPVMHDVDTAEHLSRSNG